MHKVKNKYDEALQDYARKWMRSLDRPRYATDLSYFFIAIFLLIWSNNLSTTLGYPSTSDYGILVILCIALFLIILIFGLNSILKKIGLQKVVRSSFWFGALIGPYASIIAMNKWSNPALSHIIGFFCVLVAFLLNYYIAKVIGHRSQRTAD